MAQGLVAQTNVKLPIDLLHLLCTELANRLDYDTLFNCAVSSKHFADSGALANLYRISHQAPVKSGNETLPLAEQTLLIQKWSIMWRTILLSCYDKAMYPYVHFLRVLDLRDLFYLLDEDKFRVKIFTNFFSGPLEVFDFMAQTPGTRTQKHRAKGLNLRKNVAAIGDVIVKNAPMLEELTEPIVGEFNILSDTLPRWAPNLGRLQSLELWDGRTLGNEAVRDMLHTYCPSLRRIRVYQWREDDSDHKMAQFISNMPADTLIEFENHGECGLGPETCLAFSRHSKSLTNLALALPDKGINGLGLLQSCTNIEKLKLTDIHPPHNIKETMQDTFLDVVNWLKNCKRLRSIDLTNFVSAPDILTEFLEENEDQLEELQISGRDDSMYILRDYDRFHLSIGKQGNLRSLFLKAEPEPLNPPARDLLVAQICKLKSLRDLNLTNTSAWFQDQNVIALARHLPLLEEFIITGWSLGDASLDQLSSLHGLKNVSISGSSSCTLNGLLHFISNLGPSNQGLSLSIDFADFVSALTSEEQDIVRDALMDKVQGRFEYQMGRDPDQEDYEYSSESE